MHFWNQNHGILLSAIVLSLILTGLIGCTSEKEKGLVGRIKQLDETNQLVIQLAELEIDAAQLETYLAFLEEGIRTSVETEPGVLTLYAMAEEGNPNRIKVLEIYAGEQAYESHIASKHFQKYKKETLRMVDSLKLTRMKPITFAAKTK